MVPRVLNMRRITLAEKTNAVFVGRPSKWGNPFSHIPSDNPHRRVIKVASRERAIACYREWLAKHPQLIEDAKKELRGKHLVCYCAPMRCHADILLEIAND